MNEMPPIVQSARITCIACGYDLAGTAVGSVCPECGRSVADSIKRTQAVASTGSNSAAVTSMIFGILGIVLCAPLGIVGIILYYTARNNVESGISPASSMGMAKAGLILGWISVGLIAVNIFFLMIFFGFATL